MVVGNNLPWNALVVVKVDQRPTSNTKVVRLQMCYMASLDGCPKMRCGSPMDLARLVMVVTTSCANLSKKFKVKLVRVLHKPNMVCMVVKMSYTLTSRLIDCSFFPSNSVDVKYSQMLM
jgi:hypothetical protein